MDSNKETNQGELQWCQSSEKFYQNTSSYTYKTSTSQYSDRLVKLQEFANLVQKHYSKETAKILLLCANMIGPEKLEQDGWIDSKLVILRNYDKIDS
jgi:polyphosphate kinase 2 (PPK2 family)